MNNTKRIEQLKQESKELARQGSVLEAVEKFNEAWNLQFSETKPKIRPEIMAFAEAMEAEMARHDPEKGDSWKTMPVDKLSDIMGELVESWWHDYAEDYETPAHDYVDIANLAMMIWHRTKGD
jgi:hypothetical protein